MRISKTSANNRSEFPVRAILQKLFVNLQSAWFVLIVGVVVTAFAAITAKADIDANIRKEFAFDCNVIKNKISERLSDHAHILRSGAAFFDASESVSRREWHVYTERQSLDSWLPGIQGVGFSLSIPKQDLARHIRTIRNEGFSEYTVYPGGERDIYSSIIYLEPFSGRNLRAFGYDMFSDPVRRAAMEKARDTKKAALSGKVLLVQETESGIQAGTLMYVPVYRSGMPTETVVDRRAAIFGWIFSPYRMNDLMQGILLASEIHDKNLSFQLFDGKQQSPQQLLYEYRRTSNSLSDALVSLTQTEEIDCNGNIWSLLFEKRIDSLFSSTYSSVWLTVAMGSVITLLFFLIFYAQKQRAELERQNELNFKTLADSGQALIWLAGTDKLCNYFNKVWLDFTGRTLEQEYGNGWAEGVHPDDFDRCLEIYVTSFDRREAFSMDYRLKRHDGEYRWIQDDGCPRYDIHGAFIGYIGYCLDITDRKNAASELQDKNNELESFTYTVSHDLKSPLITIQSYAGMIAQDLEQGKTSRIKADLKRIEDAASKMTQLLNDLLELSRIGKTMKEPVELDMNKLVSDVLTRLTGIITANSITTIVQPDLPSLRGDYHRMVQAVQNLIENAVKYRSENKAPVVEIGCSSNGKEHQFFVQDNGKGIEPHQRERIFGLFTKLDSTSAGTGVGLALVKKIIEKHGGRIWVESEGEGTGSRFCFVIP